MSVLRTTRALYMLSPTSQTITTFAYRHSTHNNMSSRKGANVSTILGEYGRLNTSNCNRNRHVLYASSETTDLSTLTIPELKVLLRDQGLKVSGNKPELISRLSTLAEQKKREKTAQLSSMATEMRQNQLQSRPYSTPSLKQQVKAAIDSRKSSAETNDATGDKNAKTTKKSGFRKMEMPPSLVTRLDEMGIIDPTPIQTKAIPLAIKGKDIMGIAQTGTGKTLAFGVPLVSQMLENIKDGKPMPPKSVRGLVLAPTRELANQIAVELGTLTQRTPIRTFVVVGGKNINTQMNKIKSGTDILVATPGRLIDLMERNAIMLKATTFLVLDEADMMLDMGFLPSLRKISKMLSKKRQTMLFSATMSKDMNLVASSYLQNPVRVEVARSGKTADKITQELHFIPRIDKTHKLIELLGNPDHREDRAIVFGRTKHGMEKLSKKLIAVGIQAGSIHGNKSQSQRDRAIAAFKLGEIKVLVATDVAARGLDIPDVKRVYNFELPNIPEAYVHRIGRTARAGKDGAAIAFCSVEEMDDLNDIQKMMGVNIPVVSGSAWKSHETKQAKEKMKDNKNKQEQLRRESMNRKKQGGDKYGNKRR